MSPEVPSIEFLEWFAKTGAMYGLGFVALLCIVILVFWLGFKTVHAIISFIDDLRRIWIPQIVTGHLKFLSNTDAALSKLAEGKETTHSALRLLIKAAKSMISDPNAVDFLDKAIEVIDKHESR